MYRMEKQKYIDSITMLEKLYRLYLDLIKVELDVLKVKDINNVQSLILYNISDSSLTVGELTERGYYMGSNVSYNLRKMVQNGYVVHKPSPHDRRSTQVHLSAKGLDLYKKLDEAITSQVSQVIKSEKGKITLDNLHHGLEQMELFWKMLINRAGR